MDLVDASDFCRTCRGRGGEDEITPTGAKMRCPCPACRGTGRRTVRLDPKEAAMPLMGRPIHTYRPDNPQRKCIAMIEGFPAVFRGPTPFAAKKAAARFAEAIDTKQQYQVQPEEAEEE